MKTFAMIVVLVAIVGCGFDFDGEGGGSYSFGSYSGSDSVEETENKILISGAGETLVLEYNTLSFAAKLNWQDGNYYFSPDPEGAIGGHKIICAVAVSANEMEGNCFRNGRVCHFVYYETGDNSQDKDAYRLGSTSCKTAAAVGPFLVSLESPLCGKDPFPSCPPNNLWPDSVNPEPSMSSPLPAEEVQTPMPEVDEELDGRGIRGLQ